jgi:hypothetical protein
MQGIEVDTDDWKQRNFNYLWPTRLLKAKSDLECLVPAGASYILVDDNEWGATLPLEGRQAIPFASNAGESWGPPADDQSAIALLDRHCRHGEKYLVFWWSCFWWLEHYQELRRHLNSRFPCVLKNDRLQVFELVKGATVSDSL